MMSPTATETSPPPQTPPQPPPPLVSSASDDTLLVSSSEGNLTMEEKHILMVSFSAQGHINPMLRLGKHLISKGLQVTLAATELTRQRMVKSTSISDRETTKAASGVELVFFSDGMSLDYNRGANLDYFMDTISKAGPINLSALIKNRYPDGGQRKLLCLIANPFVPWVVDVAVDLGIPSALLWIQPCSLYSIYYNFYNNNSSDQFLFPTEEDPGKSVELPGLPLLTTQDLPSFVLPTNPFNSMSKVMVELFQSLKKFKWVLGNSFYELEKSVIDDSMSSCHMICPVGPLVPPLLLGQDEEDQGSGGVEMWKSDESCIEWLDRQEPCSVIYVSFGSIIALPAKQMEGIATALKNSWRPFLWVVKVPDITSPTGVGQLPLGFLDEINKEQGLVVPWSPQTKVLAHQAIACFVTHCGWNSMLEAICSGVPLIAYPQWTDQPTNAKLITDIFKNGVRLRKLDDDVITSSEIEKCIEEVMVGEKAIELRKSAEELKRAAREALGPGGSSDKTIQLFVDNVLLLGSYHSVKNSSDCVENKVDEEEGREDKVSTAGQRGL